MVRMCEDQIIGMWIAEPALPTEAVLCPEDIETLLAGKTSENPVARIHTNSGRSSRLVWSEQGCSFGGEHKRERGISDVPAILALPRLRNGIQAIPFSLIDIMNMTIRQRPLQ